MSFPLFNALQTYKLTIEPASMEAKRAFSACGLFSTLHNRCVVLHTKCVAKAANVKKCMVFVIYAALVSTRFDRLLVIGPRTTPTNLRILVACVVPVRGFTMRGIRCQRKSK